MIRQTHLFRQLLSIPAIPRYRQFLLCLGIFILLLIQVSYGAEPETLRPCDILIDAEGKLLYTLESDARQLRQVPADGSGPAKTLTLPMEPVRMTWVPGQKYIAAVGGTADGQVVLIRVKDDTGIPCPPLLEKQFFAGHSPYDVAAFIRDGKLLLYINDRFAGLVREIDGTTGDVLRTFEVGREPYAAELTPDGSQLVVTNLLPEQRADVSFIAAKVRIIDLPSGEITPITLYNGAANHYDVAISPDGRLAFVTGTNANYLTATVQVVGAWIEHNVVSVIDLKEKKYYDMIFLDNTYRGAPNPWGITFSDNGKWLAVALSGSDEVLFLPTAHIYELFKHRLPQENQIAADDLTPPRLRYRVGLGLRGIRRLVMKDNTVWAVSCFDDAVAKAVISVQPPFKDNGVDDYYYSKPSKPIIPDHLDLHITEQNMPLNWINLEPHSPAKGVEFERSFARLGPKPEETEIRRGEILFCDAQICEEHWQSCLTCHPDARADGLSWDLMNDGTGNLKSTKSLLYSHETPPSMITGVRADAETAVRAGVVHILFNTIPEEDYCAMDEYLKSLRPVPSPRLVDGKLSESARRGKLLFESSRTGCSGCHPEPYYTDMQFHATGSQDYKEPRTRFDTPTLCEVWRTAPYLSTGHWVTLRDMFLEGKHANRDGELDALTEDELNDLIEYVLSL